VLSGDKESYRLLVERYQEGLVRYCYSLCLDEACANDVAQQAFINAYDKLESYNSKYAFSTWLYAIARNLALREIKQRQKHQPIEDQMADERAPTQDRLDKKTEDRQVHDALRSLRAEWREVIHFYYWEDKSYVEVAEIMGKPLNTIKVWMRRAKRQLEKELS